MPNQRTIDLLHHMNTAAKLPPILNIPIAGCIEMDSTEWNQRHAHQGYNYRITPYSREGLDLASAEHAAYRQRSVRLQTRIVPIYITDLPEHTAPPPPEPAPQCETWTIAGRDLARCTADASFGYRWQADQSFRCCDRCRLNLEAAATRLQRTLHVWILTPKENC